MSRRDFYADLHAVRALVAEGLGQLDSTLDDYFVNSARHRLRDLDAMLVAAAGGLSVWSRLAIGVPLTFAAVWAASAGAHAAGLPAAWVIVAAVLVLMGVQSLVGRVTDRISASVDRRRMARAPRPAQPFRVTVVTPGELTEVPDALPRARVRLVSAALRQVDRDRWRSPALLRLVRSDPRFSRIAEADLLLCQSIDYLQIYLAEQRLRRVG
jgi:hypothetical protein